MQKGFTLIELLGIIILVAVPVLIQSNKVAETKEIDDFNKTISSACETYVQVKSEEENIKSLINTSGKTLTISAVTLVDEGYLKGTMKNPTNDNTLNEDNGNIRFINSGGQITCTYTS